MVDPAPAAPNAPAGQQQGGVARTVLNFISIYLLVNFASSYFFGGTQQGAGQPGTGKAAPQGQYVPMWPPQTHFSLRYKFVAYYPSVTHPVLNQSLLLQEGEAHAEVPYDSELLGETELRDLVFTDDYPEIAENCSLNLLECVRRNCTVVAEVTAVPQGVQQELWASESAVVHRRVLMTGWYTENKPKERNLFDEDVSAADPSSALATSPLTSATDRVVHFLRPSLILNLIADWTAYPPSSVPDPVKPHLRFVDPKPAEMHDGSDELATESPPKAPAHRAFLPILYVNHFWTLKEHLIELNSSTVSEETSEGAFKSVRLTYYPLSMLKFVLYVQMDASFDQQESFGAMAKGERDDTKRIFLETNPVLLGVTVVVSLLHLVFEYLAFSNDVKFWRGKKDFKGLSVRSVGLNCYFQLIIFLYLLDGETSWTVLLPSGVGVLIEFWKLRKVMRVVQKGAAERAADASTAGTSILGRIRAALPFRVEFTESYRGKTKQYDEVAMRWMFILGVPCLLGYSGYSALNHSYKGWYSFFVRTQVRFIYFSGFVMMCPQIFINYKLKCVAHMPWRTFTYKALNTVIDDLFAFIIKMPTLHRLACFRDDVVFLILLYQRWIYPVNPNMTEDGDEPEDSEAATASVKGPPVGEGSPQPKVENTEAHAANGGRGASLPSAASTDEAESKKDR